VQVDAGTAGAAGGMGRGDVDGAVDGFEEVPEHDGGGVAEDRVLAAGEECGHEAAVEGEAAVPHGVDAAVDAVELAAVDAARGAVLANPYPSELLDGDDSMLSRRDLGNPPIEPVDFLPHVREQVDRAPSPPPLETRYAPRARRGGWGARRRCECLRRR
jgi:hypothetical protein